MSEKEIDPKDIAFGETVRIEREALGLSVIEFSHKIGVSRAHIYRVEKGHPASLELRTKIMLVLSLGEVSLGSIVAQSVAFQAKVEKGERITEIDIEIAEDIRKKFDRKERPREHHAHLITLASAYRKRRTYHKTVEYAEEARTYFVTEGDHYNASRAAYEIASVDYETSRYQLAVARYERIVRDFAQHELPEDGLYHQTCIAAALCYACLGQMAEMQDYLEMLDELEMYETSPGIWRSATVDYLYAEKLLSQGKFVEANERYRSALEKFRALNDVANAHRIEHDIAWCWYRAGEHDKARELALQVREVSREDVPNHAKATNLLAEIAVAARDYDAAYEWASEVFTNKDVPKQIRAHGLQWAAQALYHKGDIEGYTRHVEQAQVYAAGVDPILFEKLTVELLTRNPLRGLPDLE